MRSKNFSVEKTQLHDFAYYIKATNFSSFYTDYKKHTVFTHWLVHDVKQSNTDTHTVQSTRNNEDNWS